MITDIDRILKTDLVQQVGFFVSIRDIVPEG